MVKKGSSKSKKEKPRKKKGYEALIEQKESAAKRSCGAWWWRFLTPIYDEEKAKPFLECEVCGKRLTASSPCKTAEEHLKIFHKMCEEVEGNKEMSLEQVRELVGERKGNAPIRRRKRRRTNESSQEQPAKHPCASSAQKVTDSRVDGVNVVGLPAQCRRQHHLPPFLVSKFQGDCANVANQLTQFLEELPLPPVIVDIGVSELEFCSQFEECASDVDISKVDLNTTNILKRKSAQHHYYNRHPEELHRATSDGRQEGKHGKLLRLWEATDLPLEDDDWFGDESLYMEVVEQSSQRYASRDDLRRHREASDAHIQNNNCEESLKKVHGCMELMANKLECVFDMMAAGNIRTKGMYRQGLGKVFQNIVRYLENMQGRDSRFHYHRDRTLAPTVKNCYEDLTQKETNLLDGMISKFEKHIAKQYKLLGEGRPLVCKTLLKDPENQVDVADKNDEACFHENATARLQGQLVPYLGNKNHLGGADGLIPNEDVVVVVKICHPSLYKARALDVMAAGHHTLEEVLKCLRCTVLQHMANLGEPTSSNYLFMEGTFYKNIATSDSVDYTEHIREFCSTHNCGWPLDPDKTPHTSFDDNDLRIPMKDLVLRVSNRPVGVYCHHGNCEHLIQIADVRLLHTSDPPQLKHGPVIVNYSRGRIRLCSLCRKVNASCMGYGDNLCVSDPSFYCKDCFQCLHYDEKGNLLVEPFLLLPYCRE